MKISIALQNRLTHKELLRLVSYDPNTGSFSANVARGSLSAGRVISVDPEKNGYVRLRVNGKGYLAHRLAWFYTHAVWPPVQIDHINCDKQDNRICNLRLATSSQNHGNRMKPKGYSAPLKGAHWNRFRNYWQSYIRVNGKSFFLGRFETAIEAHNAYAAAAKKHFGKFARAE